MARMIDNGSQIVDSMTGAVLDRGEWQRDRDGSVQTLEYRIGDRTWRLVAAYDEYRPDIMFAKPPTWESGQPMTEDEFDDARDMVLMALRKQGLDPLWDPPYPDPKKMTDVQAELRRVQDLRKKLYPKRSFLQRRRDREE